MLPSVWNGGMIMALTDAQKRARDKWLTEKVEDIRFRVPKGKKAVIQEHAAKLGESVNAFINRAVDEAIAHDLDTQKDI